MSRWLGSERCFEFHKSYLDQILEGQTEFFHKSPQSIAKILRTLLKYVRDTKHPDYQQLFEARVIQTKYGAEVEVSPGQKTVHKILPHARLNDVLISLSDPLPNTVYIFYKPRVSDRQFETIKEFCKNSGLNVLKGEDTIKIFLKGVIKSE